MSMTDGVFAGRLVSVLQALLTDAGTSGQVVKTRLSRGLSIAYAGGCGDDGSGRMTVGRNDGTWPSKKELFTVEAELKKAASNLDVSVLGVREFERDEIGNWRLVRLSIQYGKQLELIKGGDA